jgi:hypothetical protein
MVKLQAYDMATGHVETIHTFRAGHRAWSKAFRMLTRMTKADHSTDINLYLSGA